jgi:hypothetical protein
MAIKEDVVTVTGGGNGERIMWMSLKMRKECSCKKSASTDKSTQKLKTLEFILFIAFLPSIMYEIKKEQFMHIRHRELLC